MSGAGAAASHLAALDPLSLALLAPQVTSAHVWDASAHPHRPTTPSHCPTYPSSFLPQLVSFVTMSATPYPDSRLPLAGGGTGYPRVCFFDTTYYTVIFVNACTYRLLANESLRHRFAIKRNFILFKSFYLDSSRFNRNDIC